MISINANSLKWAYKKLKNYIYYASPASYLKDKIVQFEKKINSNTFDDMEKELLALFSKERCLSNQGIGYCIFPKKDGVVCDDNGILVKEFNVFIDMPIKFYLVDILFTLNLFESLEYDSSGYAFGNDFDKSLWQIKKGEIEGNILENNFLFANYSTQYQKWKEKIYDSLDNEDKQEKLILKLDFKRSFYNINFDIKKFIDDRFKHETNNPVLNFEKQLYCYYSIILNSIIPSQEKRNKNYANLPIGLFSSAIIYNILLNEFDLKMMSKSIAYSRYVDDILIVVPKIANSDFKSILDAYFPDLFIQDNDEYVVNKILDSKGKYIINHDKTKILKFKNGYPLTKFKAKFNKVIKSSLDIIDDMDFDDENFDEEFLFKHDYLKSIIKSASRNLDKTNEIIGNLTDTELIEIHDCWKELLSRTKNSNDCQQRIKQAIDQSFIDTEQTKFNNELKKTLNFELEYAVERDKYREYLLCDINQKRIFEHIKKIEDNEDDFTYPLNVTYDEITLYLSQKHDAFDENFIANVESLYKKANNIIKKKQCKIIVQNESCRYIKKDNLFCNLCDCKIRIAVANINLSQSELEKTDLNGEFPTTYGLQDIEQLICCAKKKDADLILFPEFCLPEAYAIEISKFCRKKNISIITGLTHVKRNGELINQILIRDKELDIALFKQKNYLPIAEKKFCLRNGYNYFEPSIPYYFIINNGKFVYSTMTCFEATNIKDRALLCDKIEVLFVPVYNRDTTYFSNIISSFVRDASCFVAQANSNQYGDSRISGPYKTVGLDIVKLKGGENNYFVIGEIDLNALRSKNQCGLKLDTKLKNSSGNWDENWDKLLKEYENLEIKPMSAGNKRYEQRLENELDN